MPQNREETIQRVGLICREEERRRGRENEREMMQRVRVIREMHRRQR
jgi:hypothetical protein